MSDPNLLYLAGYFDGEGSIGVSGGSLSARVVNTHRPALEEFQSAFGGSIGLHNAGDEKSRMTWVWRAYGETAENALRALMPHLREKRAQAYLGLHFRELKPGDCRNCVEEALGLLKKTTHFRATP